MQLQCTAIGRTTRPDTNLTRFQQETSHQVNLDEFQSPLKKIDIFNHLRTYHWLAGTGLRYIDIYCKLYPPGLPRFSYSREPDTFSASNLKLLRQRQPYSRPDTFPDPLVSETHRQFLAKDTFRQYWVNLDKFQYFAIRQFILYCRCKDIFIPYNPINVNRFWVSSLFFNQP
jgi:hypothetical protein